MKSGNLRVLSALLKLCMCSGTFGITIMTGTRGWTDPTPNRNTKMTDIVVTPVTTFSRSPSTTKDIEMDASVGRSSISTMNAPSISVKVWWITSSIPVPTSVLDVVDGEFDNTTNTTPNTVTGFSWYPINWSWVLILQLVSAVIGIVGNFLVIIVLFQRRKKSRSTDILIGWLACADFLTSVFIIPVPWASYVPNTWLGQVYCRAIYTWFFLWASITASAYLLMSISIERYIAIVYPIHFNRVITRRRVSVFIVFIWILSVLSGLFVFIVHTVDGSTNTCTQKYMSRQAQSAIAYYWFCLRLVIPCMTMVSTQSLIARELNRQSSLFEGVANVQSSDGKVQAPSFHIVARNRVLKMMLIVILMYIICWSPNQIAYLGYNLGWIPLWYLGSPLQSLLTVLGFYNSCANPIIYTARYPEFREALKDMFTCASPKSAALFEKRRSYRATCVT